MSLLESWSTYHGFSSYRYFDASYSGLHGASMIFFFSRFYWETFYFLFSFLIWNGALGNRDIDCFTLGHLETNKSRKTALNYFSRLSSF